MSKRKRIRKKRYKKLWLQSLELDSVKYRRVHRPEVVNGKARRHALAVLKYVRRSELHPEEFDSDLIPVRFFYCGKHSGK